MKIVFLGLGEVAKCTLALLDDFITTDPRHLYFVERNNLSSHPVVNGFIERGAQYLQKNLSCENMLTVLRDEIGLGQNDLVVDLTTDTDMFHTVSLCLENHWLYLNTCIENSADPRLVHVRNHAKMAGVIASPAGQSYRGTCVFDHGMNPGLISAFVKKGLEDIATLSLKSGIYPDLKPALQKRDYSAMAQTLGLETLHLSELDDQTATGVPENAFVNTWSCPGFLVEANAPLQIAWGTHEETIPEGMAPVQGGMLMAENEAWRHLASSYVPDQQITGMLIPHEEIVTLRKILANPGYAPTIVYVYEVNPHTRRCFDEGLTEEDGGVILTPVGHALTGSDRVGALFILARNPVTGEAGPWSYWCGTILSSQDPVFSPTVIQVAAGVLAAARWMIENPNAGILFPEDLPHAQILNYAAPHLGTIFSAPVPFVPAGTQFENFLISCGREIPERLLR